MNHFLKPKNIFNGPFRIIFYNTIIVTNTIVILLLSTTVKASKPAPTAPEDQGFSIAVISDMNNSYGSTSYSAPVSRAINYITKWQQDGESIPLVLSTGDMVAGQKQGLNYRAMWNAFHNVVTNPLAHHQIAFAPSPGNHDASSGKSFATERLEYQNTFKQRETHPLLIGPSERFENAITLLPNSNFPLYYAFIFKNSLFISLDATAVGPLRNSQMLWLKETLKSQSRADFKIIFGHMPLLPFAKKRAHEHLARGNTAAALDFENLLNQYEVDLFLSGHHHVFYPGRRNAHTRFISVPCLGAGARALLNKTEPSANAFLLIRFDKKQGISLKAIQTKDMTEIPSTQLPSTITMPKNNSADCELCATFPEDLFLNKFLRTLYTLEY